MIFFPNRKEPHYFNTDLPGNRWHPDWGSYLSLYSEISAKNAVYRGDASVNYLYSVDAAKNIALSEPKAKILICLRSPISFIRSYHNQKLINLDEDIYDLNLAWNISGKRSSTKAREPKLLDYKSIGLFFEQINRYREHFPDNQIRILTLEELKKEPRRHYQAIIDWLGLLDDERLDFNHINPAATHRSRFLAKTLKYPPTYLRKTVQPIKQMFGVNSLGIAKLLNNFNTARGYRSGETSDELAKDIARHFAKDQECLKQHDDLRLLGVKD